MWPPTARHARTGTSRIAWHTTQPCTPTPDRTGTRQSRGGAVTLERRYGTIHDVCVNVTAHNEGRTGQSRQVQDVRHREGRGRQDAAAKKMCWPMTNISPLRPQVCASVSFAGAAPTFAVTQFVRLDVLHRRKGSSHSHSIPSFTRRDLPTWSANRYGTYTHVRWCAALMLPGVQRTTWCATQDQEAVLSRFISSTSYDNRVCQLVNSKEHEGDGNEDAHDDHESDPTRSLHVRHSTV